MAPASKSAARTAASDLNQLAVRWLELFSITGELLISSIGQTEECRKHQNKARPASRGCAIRIYANRSPIRASRRDGFIGLVICAVNPAASERPRSSYSV